MTRWILAAAGCLLSSGLAAQDDPTARVLCDPADSEDPCTEDVLAIRFDRSGGPILEVEAEPGLSIEATVVLETMSASIQGWSYGVKHEGRAVVIESATTEGTDTDRLFKGGFRVMTHDISECVLIPCSIQAPATGFVSAVILSLLDTVVLPTGTNSLARMTYRLEGAATDEGKAETLLEFTGRLAQRGKDIPVAVSFTNDDRQVLPRTVIDGKILVEEKPFHRGDPDGDGRISIADAVAILLFLFLAGPPPGCLEAGDADDDGRIDTTDAVVILRWLFGGGSSPAPPGPPPAPCSRDPEGSSANLGCDAYGGC